LERDVDALLDQLGLDNTFFMELALIAFLFVVLSRLYFQPFLKLFEARHKKTVEDKLAAEKLLAEANSKLEEYKNAITLERANARKDYENTLIEARKEESRILAEARDEAKRITQKAAESIQSQHEQVRRNLEVDVESFAQNISERLLSRKV